MKLTKCILILISVLCFPVLSDAQKQTPPAGGTPKDFTLPSKKEFTLDNGMGATLVQYGALPKTYIRVVIKTGNIDETADQVWLADLTGEFLTEGTKTRTAKDIANQAADMGGEIGINTGLDQSFAAGEVLSEFAPKFIELLADVVQNPSFPEKELERIKNNMLRDLSVQKTQPQPLAQDKFLKVIYGEHPYGRLFPTEAQLKGYKLEQVQEFFKTNYGAKRAHIYVVGKFNESAVESAIKKAFEKWSSGNDKTVNIPKITSASGRNIYLIDRPGAPQSTLYIGLPVMDPSNPDYVKFVIMNNLLGGSFGSRITSNIRENKGYTYSPASQISIKYRNAYWVEVADVTTKVTGASIKEILYEIDRLGNEPPKQEELDGIKNYAAGIFVLQNSATFNIANQLSFLKFHGLPDSYLTNYVKNVYAVTPEDVTAIAKNSIKSNELSIVIVGDIKEIRKQVEPYGKIIQ